MNLLRILCVVLLALAGAGPARAADPFAPAVIVNDQLVTQFDVEQRLRFMNLMGFARGENGRTLAIESLIDDRLRAQAAKALGVRLTEDQLNTALLEFAKQRNLSVDQMFARLKQAGVTRQAVIDLIENQAAFREAMRLRFLAQATPTDSEVENARSLQAGTARTAVRLGELVLPVRERGEAATRALAEEIHARLKAGGDFAAEARRVSRAPTARRGGEVGWLPLDRLPPEIATRIALLGPGEVTDPIDVPGAIVILTVIETRDESAAPAAPAANVTVGRLVIALRADASETDVAAAEVEAEQVGRELRSCADIEARKASYGRGSGITGPVALASLPEAERAAVATLAPGTASAPVRIAGGVAVFVVCERTGTATETAGIEELRNRLFQERMVSYATGYLQELRRDAVIEYR